MKKLKGLATISWKDDQTGEQHEVILGDPIMNRQPFYGANDKSDSILLQLAEYAHSYGGTVDYFEIAHHNTSPEYWEPIRWVAGQLPHGTKLRIQYDPISYGIDLTLIEIYPKTGEEQHWFSQHVSIEMLEDMGGQIDEDIIRTMCKEYGYYQAPMWYGMEPEEAEEAEREEENMRRLTRYHEKVEQQRKQQNNE